MNPLIKLPVDTLFEQAASTQPAPGGGSVTALCGMLGVGLILKALRITLKRSDDAELKAAEPELERLARCLAADADADAASFTAYMVAALLPRETPEDAEARAAKLKAAAVLATEVALGAVDHSDEAAARARAIGDRLSPRMAPDLDAGLRLLAVTRSNALQNASDNIGAAEGAAEHAALSERLAAAG